MERDPRNPDSDGDTLTDGSEDRNGNGVHEPELDETDPTKADTDDGGVPDGIEINENMTDPTIPQTMTEPMLIMMAWMTESKKWSAQTLVRRIPMETQSPMYELGPPTSPPDTDGDGIIDADTASDNDGLPDADEVDAALSSPCRR